MHVRAIRRSELHRVAGALGAAFEADPFSRWMFGADDRLRERLSASFRTLMRAVYLRKGHAYTTDDLTGASLWAPPGSWKLTTLQQLRMAPAFLRLVGVRGLGRAAPLGRLVDGAHPIEPHWYLAVLGVAPSHQRRGIGEALMRPVLDRADAEGVLAYLETSRPENVPYYERHGFTVVRELDLPSDGPRLWTMSRRPGAGA